MNHSGRTSMSTCVHLIDMSIWTDFGELWGASDYVTKSKVYIMCVYIICIYIFSIIDRFPRSPEISQAVQWSAPSSQLLIACSSFIPEVELCRLWLDRHPATSRPPISWRSLLWASRVERRCRPLGGSRTTIHLRGRLHVFFERLVTHVFFWLFFERLCILRSFSKQNSPKFERPL